MKSQTWDEETLRSQDTIVIAIHHQAFGLTQLAAWAILIIDTRNAMKDIEGSAIVVKA